jgi:hypothetical protein
MDAAQDAAHECQESYEECMNNRAQRVRAAIAQGPEKSDRAIAAALGVSHDTVAKHRKATGDTSPVDKRIGKDGKARRLPKIGPDPAKSLLRSRALRPAPGSLSRSVAGGYRSSAELDAERLRLDLPPRVASSSTKNTDHVERQYTNLVTVWNNSSDPARARFLKAIGVSPAVIGRVA